MNMNKKIMLFCAVSLIAICVFLTDRGTTSKELDKPAQIADETSRQVISTGALFPVGIRRTASRRQTARQHQMVRRCQMLRQHQTARRWQTVRQRQIVRRHRMDRLRKQASQRSRDTMIRITSGKTVQEKRAHQMKIRGMLAEPGGKRIHRDRAVVRQYRKRTERKVQRTVDAPLPVKRRPNRRNRNRLSR